MQDTQKREIIKKALEEVVDDMTDVLVRGNRTEIIPIKDGIRTIEIKRKEIKNASGRK